MDLYDFPALLPRWHDFLALKGELDPTAASKTAGSPTCLPTGKDLT